MFVGKVVLSYWGFKSDKVVSPLQELLSQITKINSKLY